MNIGLVGLGKMGGAIYLRLISKGFTPLVYDSNANAYTKHMRIGTRNRNERHSHEDGAHSGVSALPS